MMKSKHSSKKGIGGKPHRDHGKPSYGNGKAKDSKNKAPDSPEECALSFPDLRIVEKNQLPTYCQVLSRSREEGVGMEDLDRLQLELESLLTGVAVRIRDLNNEIATLNIAEERRDKKIKLALTSKKKEEDRKNRDPMGKSRPRVGTLDDPSVLGSPDLLSTTASLEPPKLLIPKNDTPNKFWLSVEPYCAETTAEDIKFLKELKATCEKEAEIQKIPPLGRHYTLRWAEEDLLDERDCSSTTKLKRKPSDDVKEMLKKASKIVIRDRVPGPLVQRLVSALVEENYVSPLKESVLVNKLNKIGSESDTGEPQTKKTKLEDPGSPSENKGENAVPNYLRKLPTYHTSACFELRIRKELEASGFIDPQDYKEDNDEILAEIKKCQEELRATALHTVEQLKRLIKLAEVELEKSEVRKKLKAVEQEVVEVSRKILILKQKKKPIPEKEQESAWKLLNERKTLLKTLESIH
ncbi:transcriptional adapter 3 [Macrosteles quadrilineatus]|uniref:transcriptional adapter 3 n=1 Tax=Macrosteles quadrilineatus TaxID=74068 RepID=UPI0023E0E0E9|nr:transcriptional adapter 3 [Macrosteles quadrilineatus]